MNRIIIRNSKAILRTVCFLIINIYSIAGINAQKVKKIKSDFYEIKVYHLKNPEQISKTKEYLKSAFLPALHRMGINKAGVFESINNDTAMDKRIYVFIPSASLWKIVSLEEQLEKDSQLKTDGAAYLNSAYNEPPYERIETILLKAFPGMPEFKTPSLTAPLSERIYELRSYESATENLNLQKVKMFNVGNEIGLFKRLNFNAVFYAEVIAGSRMPNLMYMTTFNNMAERDELWKKFFDDPVWKELIKVPEYQHNVSKADILFLRPTGFSDF